MYSKEFQGSRQLATAAIAQLMLNDSCFRTGNPILDIGM